MNDAKSELKWHHFFIYTLTVFFVGFFWSFAHFTHGDITTGLVGLWAFDDGSGTVAADTSGNHDNGTLTNGPVWISGKVGTWALSFDGVNDYVALASNPISSFASANSVCAWLRTTDYTHNTGGDSETIFSFAVDSNNEVIAYLSSSGALSIGYRLAGTDEGATSGNLTNNSWHHICYVWNGSSLAYYVDGNAIGSGYSTSNYATGNYIGTRGGSGYWLGYIDDVRVYNRALSSADVTQLYNSANPTNEAPVISMASTKTVVLPNSTTLSAFVTDDGLPSGSSVTNSWSVISGSGSVTFASSTSPVTDATFSSAGSYTLELSASDGSLTSHQDIQVTVKPSPFTLKILESGTGSGTVTGGGNNCTKYCLETYTGSTAVTLTAAAAAGSTFVGWTGAGCSGTGSCSVTVDSAKTVTAYFDSSGTGSQHTYYVDTQNGSANDSNAGTLSQPWKTIQHAANTAQAGDKVIVKAGVYHEFINMPNSGTSNNPIVFEGERDANGNWLTIIDPSTDISTGWVPAPEIGAGVYKKTDVPFETRELTINNKRVAFVYNMDDLSHVGNIYSNFTATGGAQYLALPSDAIVTSSGYGTLRFWDGIGALYGTSNTSGNTTYLRLRDGSNPNGLNIRAAPNKPGHQSDGTVSADMVSPTLSFNGNSYIDFRDFMVRGGFAGFYLAGNNHDNTIESNSISNGYLRVEIGSGSNNVIRNNEMTDNFYGYDDPGAWGGIPDYGSVIRANMYVVSKFLMGGSSSFAYDVDVGTSGTSNQIYGNHIFKGLGVGVRVGGSDSSPTQNTDISYNTIENEPSIAVLTSDGETGTQIHDNSLSDSNVNIRFHHMDTVGETNRIVYIYRNKLWNPLGVGDQIYVHFNSQSGNPYHPTYWVYHNSFSGGQYGLDVSSYATNNGGLPNVRFVDNIFSGNQFISDGDTGSGFITNAGMIGLYDYNLVTPVPGSSSYVSYPSDDPPAWFGSHNVRSAAIWALSAIPDFVLLRTRYNRH